jgi:type I restriction enzyme S subunit
VSEGKWPVVSLGELIASIEAGASFRCRETPPEADEVGVAKVSAVSWGRYDENESKTCLDASRIETKLLIQKGDFLISRANTVQLVGACVIAERVTKQVMLSDKTLRIQFTDPSLKPWVLHYLRSREGRDQIEALCTGNQESMRNISQKSIRQIQLPLAPAEERDRVIAYLDQQLSRLQASVEIFGIIQAKLKQARASILKAAVEGRLVETEADLARRNATDYENADALLQRCLAEKKRLFQEAQLQEGKRKTWKDPSRPGCHDTSSKPEGWTITSMEQIADVSGGLAKDSKITSGESLPYLRVANVQRGNLDLEHIKTIICPFEKVDGMLLKKGDVLLNEGGDRDKLGRGWVWNGEISRCIHQNHVFKARLALPAIQPRYISYYCNTLGESYFQNEGKQTTNLASISLSKVRALPIALPPASEQRRILEEIDRRFSVLNQVEAAVQTNLARCGKLRQAILKQAFGG